MPGAGLQEMAWVEPAGQAQPEEAWQAGAGRGLGERMAGECMDEGEEHGASMGGETVLWLWHAAQAAMPCTLPATREGQPWERVRETTAPPGKPIPGTGGPQDELQGSALVVLWTSTQQEAAALCLARAAAVRGGRGTRPGPPRTRGSGTAPLEDEAPGQSPGHAAVRGLGIAGAQKVTPCLGDQKGSW